MARCDPPRHVDVIIPSFIKIRLMQPYFVKNLCYFQRFSFSAVYRGATASGTVSRVPGRSTCIGHTKDELRRPCDGRVHLNAGIDDILFGSVLFQLLCSFCSILFGSILLFVSVQFRSSSVSLVPVQFAAFMKNTLFDVGWWMLI